jgi:hypothetical protein
MASTISRIKDGDDDRSYTLAIMEAFFPRHVPEVKLESDRPVASGAPDSSSGGQK